ncbi:MAG: homoserine dehydrogenase [Chloroflexota bacterium]|nr:homoserine dehydrogenase [Chloroflexota bacterium]
MGGLPSQAPLRVALLGLGNVGRPVAARLLDDAWRARVSAAGIVPPVLVAVGVRDSERARGIDLPDSVRRTDDLIAAAADPEIDVVIELVGGTDGARSAVECAVEARKSIVTANKALLATCGPALEAAVRGAGTALRFEAAVCGGTPVLGPLVHDLAANRIDAVRGIVNGTTNHILSAMARDARSYEDVLDEAQARGYAEADPSGDVTGMDSAHKLAILMRLAFGAWPDVARIRRTAPVVDAQPHEGITGVQAAHLRKAAGLGLTLKLVARAERAADGALLAGVTLAAVPLGSPLGEANGVTNVVEVVGTPIGRVAFRGPGAGGDATSSAVLADLLALARGEGSTWDPLPPAGAAEVADDLEAPRAWYFTAPELLVGTLPRSVSDVVLVSAEDAIVTRPMDADDLRVRLAGAGYTDLTLYPVLEMGTA